MIGIRVDGNPNIATGHIMRCLAIAEGLKRNKIGCIFIISDDNSKQLLMPYNYPIISLNTDFKKIYEELPQLNNIIIKYQITKMIVDTYYATPLYLNEIEKYSKVIFFDDFNCFYPVSTIINYNLNTPKIPDIIIQSHKTQLLLGVDYVPLRSEFHNKSRVLKKNVSKILITVGGGDTHDILCKLFLKFFFDMNINTIEYHIVVGPLNKNFDELINLSHKYPSINIHYNVKEMAKLMLECDIAITAGGTTMYELCACGTPSISISIADNQLDGVKSFSERGLIDYAGDVRYNEYQCLNLLRYYLEKYISDFDLRNKRSNLMKKTIHSNGVTNIISKAFIK